MNLDRGRQPPPRHPLGRRCGSRVPLAMWLTALAMWRHRGELRSLLRDDESNRKT